MRFEDFIYFNDDALSLDDSNKIVNFVKQNRKTFELFSADRNKSQSIKGLKKNKMIFGFM